MNMKHGYAPIELAQPMQRGEIHNLIARYTETIKLRAELSGGELKPAKEVVDQLRGLSS